MNVRQLGLAVLLAPSLAAAAPPTDDEFRQQVAALAKARHRVLMSWGTAQLDGSERPHRFAALGVELGADNNPARAADRTGAYIVEEAPGTFWLIAYPWDATSWHVGEGEGPDGNATGKPPWLVLPETAVWHGLNHNHGKAYVWFGFRGGRLVALADEDDNVRREPEGIRTDYAVDDACTKKCPTLRGTYKVQGYAVLRVVGSARSIAALPAF